MPPVRWKTFQVLASIFMLACYPWNLNAEETISIGSDGWRPIVGTQKEPVYHDEIKYYRNPSFLSETVKAETTTVKPTTSTTSVTSPKPPTTSIPNGKINVFNSGTNGQILRGKIPPHSKHPIPSHFYILPKHGSHGPHIPLRSSPQNGKIHNYVSSGKRHPKPVRVPVGAHSYRDEIFLPAPSGPHSFYKGQNVVKIRETQGLGIPGAPIKQYHLQHQPSLEFGNQFSLQNDVFQNYNPVHNFVPRPGPQTESHFSAQNDEYTRNLLPPPYIPKKPNKPSTKAASATTESSASTKNLQFNVQHAKYKPSTVDVQFASPHETQQQFNVANNKEKTVELQVTKEKLQVFHNTVPPNHNFQPEYSGFNDYRTINQASVTPSHLQTYEVTENKFWQETPNVYRQQQFATAFPEAVTHKKRPSLTELQPPTQESADIPFLPTPFQPDNLAPTSPTQSEVSTIFTKLSVKQKAQAATDPTLYDVKEVSTHYPIFGSPIVQEVNVNTEVGNNEVVTTKEVDVTETPAVVVRQRPKQRRRRPGYRLRTTTEEEPVPVTEHYEMEKVVDVPPSRRPLRRRPIRYRTTTSTTSPEEVENQQIYRKPPQRFRVQTTEEPQTTQRINEEVETEIPDQVTERTDEEKNEIYEEYNGQQTEAPPTIAPSGEVNTEETVTVREIFKEETTLATTTVTTTTTEAAISKPQQTRRRPIKYDTNRPRFSVKEYRQRLNQYSSTTTTEAPKTSSETARTRFANRFRRPTTTTTSAPETITESTKTRQRNKEATSEAIITDKPVKAVNTRLRPFGRYRSTTEAAPTTQKVSIRPNIFNSLRRPTPISLRKRINNKLRNNTEETTTTSTTTESVLNTIDDNNSDAELSETIETAIPYTNTLHAEETSTEFDSKKLSDVEVSDENQETTMANDIMRNDSILQRVSDLTSSAKDTPGLFKSVAPISRRVPSYFTIATDDPILPIESVFANIRDNDRSRV